jgi:hypothetical protein
MSDSGYTLKIGEVGFSDELNRGFEREGKLEEWNLPFTKWKRLQK